MSRHATLALTLFLLAQPHLNAAQDAPQPGATAPAHVGFSEGAVTLERDARSVPPAASMPLIAGDRIRTDRGRLEVLFGDGSTLYVDEYSTLDLLSDSLVRLISGRLDLVVARDHGAGAAASYQIDTPAASVRTDGPGEYRIAARTTFDRSEVELATVRGSARLFTDVGAVTLRAGERSVAREREVPSSPQPFNSARWDPFERWAQERQDARRNTASAQYLPPELQPYAGTFDRYGSWAPTAQYGYVWYPTSVSAGWRPYYNGHWMHVRPYGWTWIGADAWAWPTHHFGRWGLTMSGTWFWIPARTWAPAWVHWAIAPGFVSWCPLGINGQPVVPFWARSNFAVYERVFDPSFAWTVIPDSAFGVITPIVRVAIDGRRFREINRPSFIMQPVAPPGPRDDASHVVRWPSASDIQRSIAVPRTAPQVERDDRLALPSAERRATRSSAVPRSPSAHGIELPAPPSPAATGGVAVRQAPSPLHFERPSVENEPRAVPRNPGRDRELGWSGMRIPQPSSEALPHGVAMPGSVRWPVSSVPPSSATSAPPPARPAVGGLRQPDSAVPRFSAPPPAPPPAATPAQTSPPPPSVRAESRGMPRGADPR